MTKKIHVAISTHDMTASVDDYSARLGCQPAVLVTDKYALWRTEGLNLSVRVDTALPAGTIRHLGVEDAQVNEFSSETDVNDVLWEHFSIAHQADEICQLWPQTKRQLQTLLGEDK